MSRYLILVAMVAASFLCCGGGGSEPDTFVSEDNSTPGDNQKPDNFIPPDNQPDVIPDTATHDNFIAENGSEYATESAEVSQNPCKGYEKYNGKNYHCKDMTPSDCTMVVAPAPPPYEGECSFKCNFWVITEQLTFKEDGTIIYNPEGTYEIICTPTS